MKLTKENISVGMLVGAMVVVLSLLLSYRAHDAVGSVNFGNEYQSTTTSTGRFSTEQLLTSTTTLAGALGGALGSITVTGTQSGNVQIYDATTSDITKRAPSMASTSLLVASLPANAATGTYTFDARLVNGLYVSVAGTMPTTTITWR